MQIGRTKGEKMAEFQYELKIFLEAEDISQSRIKSSYASIKAMLEQSANSYIKAMEIEDESDLDEFVLRFYIQTAGEEEKCSNVESAKGFVDDAAELLMEISHMHSFLDMEGTIQAVCQGETYSYTFASESGSCTCDFIREEKTSN